MHALIRSPLSFSRLIQPAKLKPHLELDTSDTQTSGNAASSLKRLPTARQLVIAAVKTGHFYCRSTGEEEELRHFVKK